MRPRKSVLCVDANEQRLSIRALVLDTRGYRVITACCFKEAVAILAAAVPNAFDALVTEFALDSKDGGDAIARYAKQLHPETRVLILSSESKVFQNTAADVFLPKGCDSAAEILEYLRVLVARKRGPKKALRAVVDALCEEKKPVQPAARAQKRMVA